MKKRDLALGFILVALMVIGSINEPLPTETEPTEEDIIHWKEEAFIEETEVHIEKNEVGTVTEPQADFYNVPLSEELQLHIFAECEKHNIAPAIIIAMIERESDFKADTIGDKGNSLGLMQIQPRWHSERMERLSCTDLLDPFQNVTVGIDIVAGLKAKNADLYWVLMSYNGGQAYANRRIESGNISNYAIEVVERASELEAEHAYN